MSLFFTATSFILVINKFTSLKVLTNMRKLNSYSPIQIILVFVSGMLLSSCVGAVQMLPTITPTPTRTIKPSATSTIPPSITPTNTDVPEPTPTKTPTPTKVAESLTTSTSTLQLKSAILIPEAGFSFQPPMGYEERIQPGQVTLTSEDEDIILSLIGSYARRNPELEIVLNIFIENLNETIQKFDSGTPYPYSIGGTEGLAVDVIGEWSETPVEGRIAIVAPNEGQLFYAVAISANGEEGSGWEPNGEQAFQAVIGSITFFKPSEEQD